MSNFIPQRMENTPELAAAKEHLAKLLHRSLYLYRIDCGGCNGCEIEIFAAITPVFDAERFGIKLVSSPRHADLLLMTGPMTRAMRLPSLLAYRAAPEPKLVVAFGACGCSGGIFHDSYAVWGGADAIFPVDLYIPGCPPTPAATIYGLATAMGLLEQKIKAKHYLENEQFEPPLPLEGLPQDLCRAIQRQARRMCGYREGMTIAKEYLTMLANSDNQGEEKIGAVIKNEQDRRQAEIFRRLHQIYLHWKQGGTLGG